MIRIEVTAFGGEPPQPPLTGEFGEQGGTIGRAEGSTLLLPDPKRYISRTHASILFRSGEYFIRDLGTASPVVVNGSPLGMGHEAPLRDGDSISIAEYSLRVFDVGRKPSGAQIDTRAARSASANRLGVNAAIRSSADAASVRPAGASDPSRSASGADDGLPDPFSAGPSTGDPFGDVITPAPRQPSSVRSSASRDTPSSGTGHGVRDEAAFASAAKVLPGGVDPFADPTPPAPAADPSTGDLPSELHGKSRPTEFDRMFGLERTEADAFLHSQDPLASNGPSTSGEIDPLEAIGAAPRKNAFKPDRSTVDPLEAMGFSSPSRVSRGAVQRDDAPAIDTPFSLPRVVTDPSATPRNDASARSSNNIVRDRVVSRSEGEVRAGGAAPENVKPLPQPPVADGIGSRGADELLRAFLAGAGVPEVEMPRGLSPELMKILGQLLRECTQGTLDLLLARAIAKRQLSADVTILVGRENNPLKFSPNVETALGHLLAPQGPGFMTPVRAVKDAYNDLRSHEIATMAGMRAALTGVLARFRPEQLEKRLTQTSVLDSLLPMNRQAKLWALFGEYYAEISKEAEDNFHSLFGREFLRAYEEQIEKLDQAERKE